MCYSFNVLVSSNRDPTCVDPLTLCDDANLENTEVDIEVMFCSDIIYRKPPNISPGLIFVRKHFFVGLYMGGLYTGCLYTDKILC